MTEAFARPVWHALTGRQAHLAQGSPAAWRLDPAYGPFGAAADPTPASMAALAALIPEGGELWLVEPGEIAPPPGTRVMRSAACRQMIAPSITPGPAPATPPLVLTDADAPEMRALAALTQPGPFAARTNRLGRFIGVRDSGRLVAMAGERMRPGGFTEVSGVCTHPDARGRGLAGALMREVAQRILDRGEAPFLHSYASNDVANRLYRTLGFADHADVVLSVLARS